MMVMVGVGICAANSSILRVPINGLWRLFPYLARFSANGDDGFQFVGSHQCRITTKYGSDLT